MLRQVVVAFETARPCIAPTTIMAGLPAQQEGPVEYCGQGFPAFSPSNSGAGDTDWGMAQESILICVAQFLSPADLRRARLACKPWLSALAKLSTKATTPPEGSTVTRWKGQLETMVLAMPCLQVLTIGSKLSSVGAQQLGVLAAAKQLRALNIPHGQALQDRSLQALQPLATTLKELRIRGAASLTSRSLLLLCALSNLEVLELKNCAKLGWHQLQEAWRAVCTSYEAHKFDPIQFASQHGAAGMPTVNSSSSSSNSGGSRLGGWLPAGRLFRTSSPSSYAIQSALIKQRSGAAALFAKLHGKSSAAAPLGFGAVGNFRSSSGGGLNEVGPVHKLLQTKQKSQRAMQLAADIAARAQASPFMDAETQQQAQDAMQPGAAVTMFAGKHDAARPVAASESWQSGMGRTAAEPWSIGSVAAPQPTHTAMSALSRVGSLMRQGTSAAAAALNSGTVAKQSSSMQSALTAYLAEAQAPAVEAAQPAAPAFFLENNHTGSFGTGEAGSSGSSSTGGSSSRGTSRFGTNRKRRPSLDRPLPAMPFTKLTSLSFTCSEVTFKNAGSELAAIAALTSLTHLELGNCKLPDGVLWRLGGLTRLAKLKMSGLWLMGDKGLAEVAQLTALSSLALSGAMQVTAQGLLALTQLTALTSLALGLTQDLGSGAIAKVASTIRQLKCLEVTAPCFDDADCELLAEAAATAAARATATASPIQQQQQVHMLWDLPTAATGSYSRSNSSKLLLPPHSASSNRSNSSHNLRAPSCLSMQSAYSGFGTFTFSTVGLVSAMDNTAQQQKQQLAVLRLHGCSQLTHRGLAAIKQLPYIQTLALDNCKQVHAAEVISQDLLPPKLINLSLKTIPFGNLFSNCVNMPACSAMLTRVELVALTAVHSGQLRRLLCFFPGLQELDLSGCVELSDAAVKHLMLLRKLQKLSLSGTRITSQAFDHLLQLPELRVLGLRGCNLIADAGLRMLEVYPSLQEIDLAECGGVTERGVLAVMRGVRGLVRLDVSGCKGMTRDVVQCCPHYLHLQHNL